MVRYLHPTHHHAPQARPKLWRKVFRATGRSSSTHCSSVCCFSVYLDCPAAEYPTYTLPDAFKEFLTNYKTTPEHQITHALGNINIDDDDLSDEYDFADETNELAERRAQEKMARRKPQHKYLDMLQKLADRKIDELVIDLDDLSMVRVDDIQSTNPEKRPTS